MLARIHVRRGTTVVQNAAVMGLIALVAAATLVSLGGNSSTKLNTTAKGVADPAQLKAQFGS